MEGDIHKKNNIKGVILFGQTVGGKLRTQKGVCHD